MLAVEPSVLRPGTGAAPLWHPWVEGHLVKYASLRGAANMVATCVRVDRVYFELAARLLDTLYMDSATRWGQLTLR